VVLVRALLLRLLTLALPALVGWLSLAMASLLLSPVALLVAACVHGALFAAGYSGTPALAAHGIAAALQILAFLAAAGFFAGLPLHRHSVAAATYWPAFLAEEDDHFGRLLSVAAEGVRAATEGRGTGLQRTP
jgi:TPP-dependent indolepyruvate ferredoxin oxidoreductase alpha subunit